jgi:hypothetical protein
MGAWDEVFSNIERKESTQGGNSDDRSALSWR